MLGFEACDIVNIVIPFLMVYSSYRSRQWLGALDCSHWNKVGWSSRGFDFNKF
jgi:hypothetical protein